MLRFIQSKNMIMFYLSALVAIAGAVGYQYFVKRVPVSINPIVSVIGMYASVLAISAVLLLIFPAEDGLRPHQQRSLAGRGR